ncbi:MAG: T9SS type A sorting domain-containing protein, partial [Bacteroidetes bacterium]
MKRILLFFVIVTSFVSAQQRYLVSPNNEAYPLQPNQPASQMIKQVLANEALQTNDNCSNVTFGFPPQEYIPSAVFNSSQKDIMAMWFVAPATGTIDSIFWIAGEENSAKDSLLYIRVHESKIGPGSGPGYNFPSGCQYWGYWISSNDNDNGLAAFPEDATDTTWISTINSPYISYPPFGDEIWGLGGYPVISHPNTINSLSLADLMVPSINKDDWFLISMRVNGVTPISYESATNFIAFDETRGAPIPSRVWKFYERDNPNAFCGGLSFPKPGWVARGGQTADSTSAYAWNWWYTMTVTSDLAPTISQTNELYHTTSLSQREVVVEVEDCNLAQPESAGVASAKLHFSTDDGSTWDSVAMSDIGGNSWRGYIPGMPGNTTVLYKTSADDFTNNRTESRTHEYRVFAMENQYYTLDTNVAFNWVPIETTGTQISNWFDRTPFAGPWPQDNGTAGPIDLGFSFPFFGDTVRYAWIGVNGGITLSASATDTIDVYPDIFNCTEGYNTIPSDCNPRNYIAVLASDFVVEPIISTGEGHGAVFYQNDTDRFIVQWNHIGHFIDISDTSITFQVILDKNDSSITFSYYDLGFDIITSTSFSGLQKDDNTKWLAQQELGYPEEIRPVVGRSFKYNVTGPLGIRDYQPSLPVASRLLQNYPNPFNPTTEVQFEIKEQGFVTLTIFNILGEEVETLVNESLTPGTYHVPWDANGQDRKS